MQLWNKISAQNYNIIYLQNYVVMYYTVVHWINDILTKQITTQENFMAESFWMETWPKVEELGEN